MDLLELIRQELAKLGEGLAAALPRIGLGLIVFLIGYALTRIIRRAIIRTIEDTPAGLAVERALARVTIIVGVTLSAVLGLATMGVDVGGLVAGLGLTGLAVGLALKDTIENAITGVLLLIQRPFHVGDVINVEDTLGTVTDVAIRTTNIKTFDGQQVLIPNARVYNNVLTNWSHYPTRRLTVTVGVAYDTDLPKAYRVLSDAVINTSGVLSDPAPLVSYEGFDESSIRMVFRFWISWKDTSLLAAQTDVTESIMDAARREGIDIPFPIRTVYLQQPA